MKMRSLALVMIMLLAACASPPPAVETTLDPGADPGKYRTFAFVQGDAKQTGVISDSQVQRRLQQLVTNQLAGKGYVPAAPGERAELGVNITGHVVPKQRVFVGGSTSPYDYSWGRTEPGGYQAYDYREGTLFVDVVELAQGRLLWRAHVTEALTVGYSEENWKRVDRAFDEAFESLPPHR